MVAQNLVAGQRDVQPDFPLHRDRLDPLHVAVRMDEDLADDP